jgi:hypothetical protein
MKGSPARPGGSLASKPTWSNTGRCSTTSAFLFWRRAPLATRQALSPGEDSLAVLEGSANPRRQELRGCFNRLRPIPVVHIRGATILEERTFPC